MAACIDGTCICTSMDGMRTEVSTNFHRWCTSTTRFDAPVEFYRSSHGNCKSLSSRGRWNHIAFPEGLASEPGPDHMISGGQGSAALQVKVSRKNPFARVFEP
jgi:hypothetical protein